MMNTPKYFTPTALILALGMAFGLSACGEKDAAQSKPASAVGELAEKQEVTINNAAEPESLDPHKTAGVPEANILRQLMVGLTSTNPDGNTIPGIAEKWETSDNKVWVFHLRDAKWSNGDPVTAEDFVYSFRRITNPETASPYSSYLADVKVANAAEIIEGKAKPETLGVRAIDAKTLEITLAEPVPYLPDTLFHSSTLPVPRKAIEQFGDKWTSPENFVGNGAYKLAEWNVNEKIVLERNPQFYDDANTKINKVTFLAVGQSTTDMDRFRAGEIDFTYNDIPTEQFQSIKKEMGDQLKTAPYLCTYLYEFNVTKAPFNDVRVRKALLLAFERELFAEKVVGRGETPAFQYTPNAIQGMKDYEPEWKSWSKEQRIAEAKKLLNEAGYNEQNPLKFELLYNTSENHKKNAIAATALWKENLGFIEATLNNQEWKTFLETRRTQKQQMSRAGWCADYNEASTFLVTFKSNNSSNYGKFSSSEFDAIMDKTLRSDVDAEQRAELYRQAEAVLDKEAAGVFAYHYVNSRLVKPYVSGYSTKDPMDNWRVQNWSILKH